MSEMLKTFFASVFTEEDKDTLPRVNKVFCREDNEKLCTCTIHYLGDKSLLCYKLYASSDIKH